MPSPDVIVIGGGPAGCAAAFTLSTRGVSVRLYEREGPTRPKACGDALTHAALDLLKEFETDDSTLAALEGCRVEASFCLDTDGRTFRSETPCVVVERALLDSHLRRLAGRWCEVRHDARVIALEPLEAGFLVTIRENGELARITAKAIVIAAGAATGFSRQLMIDGLPRQGAAMTQYVAGTRDTLLFDRRGFDNGYWWAFPTSGGRLNVGMGVFTSARSAALARRFRARCGLEHTQPIAQQRGGVIPAWSGCASRWHHESGAVSCGDAAGLVHPISGEGISGALLSGRLAGLAIESYLNGRRRLASLETYSSRIGRVFASRYRASMLMDWQRRWYSA